MIDGPIQLILPYPPSINHYWRRAGSIIHISSEGRAYQGSVIGAVHRQLGLREPLTGRLAVRLDAWMPDRRRRDLDNVQKALLDALQTARVYEDDKQIDYLRIRRVGHRPPGSVEVLITDYKTEES